ncbi:MAG: hypothetical protein F6K55_08825 [Moorea sp. SIO4A3]|nr:hypothetical protein [Moorena sp. SIO4A3]
MDRSELPAQKQKRRAILALSDSALRNLKYDLPHNQEAQDLFYHDQISLLNVDAIDNPEENSLLESLSHSGDLLNSGNLLVQSPYDSDDYVEVSQAYYTFARKKWDIYTYFWGFLGAKEASVDLKEIQITKTQDTGGLLGKFSGGKGEANFDKRALNKLKKEMNLNKKFRSGGKLMPGNAKKYIKKYQWLFRDHDFEGIIELAEAGIALEEQEFSMSVNQASQSNLNVALSLNVPVSLKSLYLNGKFEQIKQEIFEFSLKTKVTFW